jgi:enoyl-CoA hydratase
MVALALATERMIAEIDGAIGWMIFNNPARRNAVSLDMWEAIPVILDRFESDPAVRVVVLRGAGDKCFIAGLDISQFEERFASAENSARFGEITTRANERILTCAKPTIAMIQGFCIGGGVQIATNCDLRIAGENARLALTPAKLGIGYPVRSLQRMVNLIGPANAKEMFFTAKQFTGAEAQAMGLVNRVVADAELEAYVRSYCATIADNAPLSIKAVKEIIAELGRSAGDIDMAKCEALVKACSTSADFIEGRRAFLEKRKPAFAGR